MSYLILLNELSRNQIELKAVNVVDNGGITDLCSSGTVFQTVKVFVSTVGGQFCISKFYILKYIRKKCLKKLTQDLMFSLIPSNTCRIHFCKIPAVITEILTA